MASKLNSNQKKDDPNINVFAQDKKLFDFKSPGSPPDLIDFKKLYSPLGELMSKLAVRKIFTKYVLSPFRLKATEDIYIHPEGLLWLLDSDNLIFVNEETANTGGLTLQLSGYPPNETFGGIKLSAKHWNLNDNSDLGYFRIEATGQAIQFIKVTGGIQIIGFRNPNDGARKIAWPKLKISLIGSNAMWTFHSASVYVKN